MFIKSILAELESIGAHHRDAADRIERELKRDQSFEEAALAIQKIAADTAASAANSSHRANRLIMDERLFQTHERDRVITELGGEIPVDND